MPRFRIIDGFKFGFGFFFGYEVAKNLNDLAGTIYLLFKKRIKQGYID